MNLDLTTILVSLVSALLGSGGVAAYVRAVHQSRIELLQLSLERIGKLESSITDLDARNDALIQQNAELRGRIAVLQRENDELTKRMEYQRRLIDEFQQKVAVLTAFERENADLRQKLQIEMSKREFLEREILILRQEVQKLQSSGE